MYVLNRICPCNILLW